MKNLEKELENLYIQKNKIEEEIELLKRKIKIKKKNSFKKKISQKMKKIELLNLYLWQDSIFMLKSGLVKMEINKAFIQ